MHPCPFCSAPVQDGASHCSNCGGPQTVPALQRNRDGALVAVPAMREPIDPWMITHPAAKERFRNDPQALEPLVATWRLNPDLVGTIRTQREIDDALAEGAIDREESYYFCCPWAPIYRIRRKVKIGGESLRPGQSFTFDVSPEGLYKRQAFKSEILVGSFNATDEIDYCAPGDVGRDH